MGGGGGVRGVVLPVGEVLGGWGRGGGGGGGGGGPTLFFTFDMLKLYQNAIHFFLRNLKIRVFNRFMVICV